MGDHDARSDPEPVTEILDPLVLRAQRGDERAFETLVRRIYDRVFRWALVRTGSPDDADEVTQRVLIRLHARLPGYSGTARFLPWLYRITSNIVADLHRAQWSRDRRLGVLPAREEPAYAMQPPLEQIQDRRTLELVRVFFQELPARQREVFDLIDLQGTPPAEVAAMLDMNASTVRANLFKARRAIRARILEQAPELAKDRYS